MTLVVPSDQLCQAFAVAGVLEPAGPALDLNFLSGTLGSAPGSTITFARASTATDGLSSDAAGSGFNTFAVNAPRLSTASGLLIEEARTNFLKNSDTPATQTTAALGIGTYVLWVIGTGSATSSAGTATGSGFGPATAGSPNVFTVTVAGTVVVTVSGSLTRFQLEKGGFPTSYIPTTGSTATRAKDVASIPAGAFFNLNGGTLDVEAMLPFTPTGQLEICGLFLVGTGKTSIIVQSGTPNVAIFDTAWAINSSLGAVPIGTVFKAGFSGAISQQFGALNGGTPIALSVSTASARPTPTALDIGNSGFNGNGLQFNGYIRRIRYWPRVLGSAELQAATT